MNALSAHHSSEHTSHSIVEAQQSASRRTTTSVEAADCLLEPQGAPVFFSGFAAGGGPSGRLAAVGGGMRPIAAIFLAAPTPRCGRWVEAWWR